MTDLEIRNLLAGKNLANFSTVLKDNMNQTFVEKVIVLINHKGLRDSAVYKAAQIDRRLFSVNPARDIGPRFMHMLIPIKNMGNSHWDYAIVPSLGLFIGAVLAVLLYATIF